MFNPKQPLWMPGGSVRAILSLLVVTPVTVIMLRSGIQFTADQAVGLASLVLAAYFVNKANSPRAGE